MQATEFLHRPLLTFGTVIIILVTIFLKYLSGAPEGVVVFYESGFTDFSVQFLPKRLLSNRRPTFRTKQLEWFPCLKWKCFCGKPIFGTAESKWGVWGTEPEMGTGFKFTKIISSRHKFGGPRPFFDFHGFWGQIFLAGNIPLIQGKQKTAFISRQIIAGETNGILYLSSH